jgi:hypothetical protein
LSCYFRQYFLSIVSLTAMLMKLTVVCHVVSFVRFFPE